MTKITCFHDGECPICNIEIATMQKIDKANNVNWVDIISIICKFIYNIVSSIFGAGVFVKRRHLLNIIITILSN